MLQQPPTADRGGAQEIKAESNNTVTGGQNSAANGLPEPIMMLEEGEIDDKHDGNYYNILSFFRSFASYSMKQSTEREKTPVMILLIVCRSFVSSFLKSTVVAIRLIVYIFSNDISVLSSYKETPRTRTHRLQRNFVGL